ncbi:hypothetical protein ACWEQN_39595 [Streptomyces sp. NPDC004129]
MLCAGAFLDAAFRRRVIEELVEHRERPVPPSLGVDAVLVLAYALRARVQELRTGLLLLGVWGVFFAVDLVVAIVSGEFSGPATSGDFSDSGGYPASPDLSVFAPLALLFGYVKVAWGLLPVGAITTLGNLNVDGPVSWTGLYATVGLSLWAARALAGRRSDPVLGGQRTQRKPVGRVRRFLGWNFRWSGWILGASYWSAAISALVGGHWSALTAVLLPPTLGLVVVWHRLRTEAVVRGELQRDAFQAAPHRPELPPLPAVQQIAEAIDREQYARLVVYNPDDPFLGAGTPYEPWSLALELKRDKSAGPNDPRLTSREIVDLIGPRLKALRASAAATSLDRLRELEVEEFVYVPAGLPRWEIPYDDVEQHLAESVDEGAEARRHFLRIRVGGWDEHVVLTVLVRVHTQGGMLVLEVAPHILPPIRPDFRIVDALAARPSQTPGIATLLRGLFVSPMSGLVLLVTGLRALGSLRRAGSAAQAAWTPPSGPSVSLRELAATNTMSLFQTMDVSRYVKTVQDRIASGVREALRSRGYATDEFDRQIVHVAQGGVFVGGDISGGAINTGAHGSATDNHRQDSGSPTSAAWPASRAAAELSQG